MYDDERYHALQLMNYQILRGGNILLTDIVAPTKQTWSCLQEAFQDAIQVEMDNTNALHALYNVGEEHKDLMFMDYLTANFLNNQVNSTIKIIKKKMK